MAPLLKVAGLHTSQRKFSVSYHLDQLLVSEDA